MKRKLLLLIMFSSLLACGKAEYKTPDLGGLYSKAARRTHDHGNAVIVIPGILGSKLRDDESGQLVWGAFEKSTANPPENLKLYLLAGDAIPTGSAVTVDSSKEHYKITDYEPGDGTVTRSSALMDERAGGIWTPYLKSPVNWSNVMFLFTDHLGLTKDPAFSDNVLYLLLEQPAN